MSAAAKTVPVISLSEGFGAVVVQGPNVSVEILDDGRLVAHFNRPVEVIVQGAAAIVASMESLASGAKMPDGTTYAGISPDTGRPMFTTPEDAPLTYTFNEAGKYADLLDAHGHRDWRVPTKDELNVLFENRAAIGGFNTSGSSPAGWYGSSSHNHFLVWTQRFNNGVQLAEGWYCYSALRCVRG